jgi:hypothetical protein
VFLILHQPFNGQVTNLRPHSPVQPGVQAWKTQIAIRTFDPEPRITQAGSFSGEARLDRVNPTAPTFLPSSLSTVNSEANHTHEPDPSGGATDGTSAPIPLNSPLLPPVNGSTSIVDGWPLSIHSTHQTAAFSGTTSPSLDPIQPLPDALFNTGDPTHIAPEKSVPDVLAPSLCYACHTQLTSRGRIPGKGTTVNRNSSNSTSNSDLVTLPVWVRPNLESACLPRDVQAYLLEES